MEGTTSRDAKPTQYIETTHTHNVNSKLRSTRWRPFTNTIQYLHCRHTTTQSTSLGYVLRRWHHHHIYTHKHECSQKYIQPYLHKSFAWTKQTNLTLNPDKTTCTLFTPDPAEYKSNLYLKINNTALCMETHPKVPGLT